METPVEPALQAQIEDIEPDEDPHLRLVVFGDPGVGKTTLALSFPRPLVINTDDGLEGDALKALKGAGGHKITPTGYKDLEALYFQIKADSAKYDTIVIDSLDELVRLLLDEVVDEGKGKRSDKVGQSILDFVPEQAEYLANQRQMHRFLIALRRLNKHIVVTSGVRQKDGQKRTIDVAPGQQTIIYRWSSIMGELVAGVELEEGKPGQHVLVVDPGSKRSVTKTRYRALLPYVVLPEGDGFQAIWSKIGQA